jgi:hypothetical protein
VGGERDRVEAVQDVQHRRREDVAQVLTTDDVVEQPSPGDLVLHRLGQQV